MLKSLIIWLTYRCQFRCPYCREWSKANLYQEVDDAESWIRALNSLPPCSLDFTGGEPFLHPAIYNILRGLDHKHHVGVTTNLMALDLDRVFYRDMSWTLSFHPTQHTLPRFMKEALLIKEIFGAVTINYVAHRGQIASIPKIHNLFMSKGFRFHVDPDETHVYSEEEKSTIEPYLARDRLTGRGDFFVGEKICDAGVHHAHVLPDGTMRRCYYNHETLGNLFKAYNLHTKPYNCQIDCGSGCDLDACEIRSLNGTIINTPQKK